MGLEYHESESDLPSPYNIRVKPVTTAPKTPESVQERDTFETPNYAVDLLIPFIPDVKWIWECAVGSGKIANRLLRSGFGVFGSDIENRGYESTRILNFLTELCPETPQCIITNPPFSIKEMFIEKAFEYNIPFAFLVNADYSKTSIGWIKRGCEKIIPESRIAFITPRIVTRVNEGEGTDFKFREEIPSELIYKYSSSQFHSMWLTYGFNIGRTETFVDLPVAVRKYNI